MVFWAVSALVLLGISVPYLVAFQAAGPDYSFGGFFVNPIDGHTYLAKMVQGASGAWRFTLPYTAEPGVGAYINTYYLALGHLAALSGLPNLVVYHSARLAGTFFMLAVLYRFILAYLDDDRERRFAFILAAFGSGLGWLTVPFGAFTADFWVAEAYPFLSGMTNPHFPLGLGLLLWMLTPPRRLRSVEVIVILAALVLGLVSPFGLAIALGVLGMLASLSLLGLVQAPWALPRLVWVFVGGAGVLVYDFWAIQKDAVLSSWNNQNLTPSPGVVDLILSFSPALVFAFIGVWAELSKPNKKISLMSLWLILVLGMIYLPFNLQRRLLTGFFVPVCLLAAVGIRALVGAREKWFGRLAALTIAISVLTNLVIIVAGIFGARTHDPLLYLDRDEAAAFAWIKEFTEPDSLILAAPSTGLWIPSQTGRRVIYGHPFETVNAEAEKAAVERIYQGHLAGPDLHDFLLTRGVDYLFAGPRERELGVPAGLDDLSVVYQGGEVRIYIFLPQGEAE